MAVVTEAHWRSLWRLRRVTSPALPENGSSYLPVAVTFFSSPFAAAMFHGRAYSFAAAEFNFAVPPRNDEDDI